MTPQIFARQMERLGGLKFRPPDLETHWEALSDLPDDILEAAVTRAQKTRVDFPTPVELRQDADQVSHLVRVHDDDTDRGVDLAQPFTITVPEVGTVVSITREWKYYCDTCSDGGWASCWCGERTVQIGPEEHREIAKPWQPSYNCDRRGDHNPHEFVRRCACWETNPALVRKRESQRQYAEKSGKA